LLAGRWLKENQRVVGATTQKEFGNPISFYGQYFAVNCILLYPLLATDFFKRFCVWYLHHSPPKFLKIVGAYCSPL